MDNEQLDSDSDDDAYNYRRMPRLLDESDSDCEPAPAATQDLFEDLNENLWPQFSSSKLPPRHHIDGVNAEKAGSDSDYDGLPGLLDSSDSESESDAEPAGVAPVRLLPVRISQFC